MYIPKQQKRTPKKIVQHILFKHPCLPIPKPPPPKKRATTRKTKIKQKREQKEDEPTQTSGEVLTINIKNERQVKPTTCEDSLNLFPQSSGPSYP